MTVDETDTLVIGAGVIGLAIARALAGQGRDVIVLEVNGAIGQETSARNSEVIHAGIYYPEGSLKATLCVTGKEQLYTYCQDHNVAHDRIGKIIVATNEGQLPTLQSYQDKAKANGVLDLVSLDRAQVAELEPAIVSAGGLMSPSTGIIDSHGLMLAYQGDLESAGGTVAFQSPVIGGEITDQGIVLDIGGVSPAKIRCKTLINASGHGAQHVAGSILGMPRAHIPNQFYALGHYFTLTGRSPFNHLIYPVADEASLGVHVTLDLGGQAKFGPDVSWVDGVDYTFDETRKSAFTEAVRKYHPDLDDARIVPGYTGIRPKVAGPGAAAADFIIEGPNDHGVSGLVNLFGIESPGLTSSLALADYVLTKI